MKMLIAALAAALVLPAGAQSPKLKVGFMLPYSGTYAALGDAIEKGFRLYVTEQGGRVGGREIEYVKVDDESDPAKATDNVNKLIKRDNVDVLVGTVHSGVAMAMAKVAKDNDTLLIIPNAGAVAVTGPMCAQNIFRSSFSNWQPGYAMGEVAAKRGAKKVVTIRWKKAAGADAEGLLTTLHYGDGLDNPKDKSFRAAYQKAYNAVPDVYAVQGYDAAQMLAIGLNASKGDVSKKAEIAKAIEAAKIDSPRGAF